MTTMSEYTIDHMEGTTLFTNGVWDMFHYGHLAFLQACAELADHIIVGMNSDYSVKSLKGDKRPIIPEYERKQMILALPFIEDVLIFDELDASRYIYELNPTYYVKGVEYYGQDIPEFEACRETGTQIILLEPQPYAKKIHTTTIIQRILERELLK